MNIFQVKGNEVWRRNFTLSISSDTGAALSHSSVEVPYGSTITPSSNTLQIKNHLNTLIYTVTATPSSGYNFSSWSGYSSPVVANQSITARTEKQAVYYTITLNSNGYGTLDGGASIIELSVLEGTTVSSENNVITVNQQNGTIHVYTFTPHTSDNYYTFGTTAIVTPVTVSGNITIPITVSKVEKTYTFAFGRAVSIADGTKYIQGYWNNTANLTVYGAHRYKLHREDSRGSQSRSYLADENGNILRYIDVNTDTQHWGVLCFYIKEKRNGENDNLCASVGGHGGTTTGTVEGTTCSLDDWLVPGDMAASIGGTTFTIVSLLSDSYCWPIVNRDWKKASSQVSSGGGTYKPFSISVNGMVQGRYYAATVGFGSSVSCTTNVFINGAAGIEGDDPTDKFNFRWASPDNNTFKGEVDMGKRLYLRYPWVRHIWQRRY